MGVLPIKKIRNPKNQNFRERRFLLGSNRLRISLRLCLLSATIVSAILVLAEEIVHGFCHRIRADVIGSQSLVHKFHYTA